MSASPGTQQVTSNSRPSVRETMAVRPVSDSLGAEITGIDLSKPISPDLAAALKKAFLDHHLLIVRDQHLEREDLATVARLFGEIETHAVALRQADGSKIAGVHTITNLDANGQPVEKPIVNSNYFWHSDKSFLRQPSLVTMLYGMEIPPEGGDTQFANMQKAYEALPEDEKRRLAGLRVVQSLEYMRRSTGNAPPTEEEKQDAPPIEHPLVRTHPETGKKSLYLGMYSSHVAGLPEEEGRALIDRLMQYATQPQFIYTQQWRLGDLVMWDNRCLIHRAIANFEMGKHRRILMRVVVRGDAPF